MANKEDLKSDLNGLYATITVLAQQLSSVVNASDFKTVYRERTDEIHQLQKFFAGIRPSKYERVKAVQIATKKGNDWNGYHTILECLGRPNTGIPTVTVNAKNCIYYDRELYGVEGNARPAEWEVVMRTLMTVKGEAERVSGQLQANWKVYDQMQLEELNENWREYDFAKNPTLLDNMGSLLVQLKSLT